MAVTGVNLPWPLDAAQLERRLDVPIEIVNDVHANARGIEALDESDFLVLNPGAEGACGNRAVLSAGTGLGEAGLFWDGNRHHGIASEGGHADFAPRTDLEVRLYYHLAAEFGHVSYERICSGPGLRNLYRFLSPDQPPAPAAAAISAACELRMAAPFDLRAAVSAAVLRQRCRPRKGERESLVRGGPSARTTSKAPTRRRRLEAVRPLPGWPR